MKKEKMIFVPAAFLMTAMLAFPAMASEKIEEVTIDINAVLTDSDNLEVEADVSDDGCYVDEISITNEPSGDWNDDTKPKVKITIGAESDYAFSSGLSKSDVYLGNDEQKVTSVTRSTSKLYVYVTLQQISDIDSEYDDEDYDLDVYDLSWDDSYGGVAYWEGTEYAKKYQVRLYRDGDSVGSAYMTTNNYYNFCGSFTKEGSYTFKTIMTIFLCIFVVFLSLTFFAFLEESNNEKEKITKQLVERKYQNITYDMMKRTKEELYRLEHSLTYYMLSIKKYLETQNQDEVYKIIDSYIERVSNVNIVIYTGNDLFDLSLTTHLSQMSSKVNMCIMMSKDEFYNHIQFSEFVLSLLDLIESKDVSLLIKEDGFVKLIQISAEYDFIDENQVKEIVNRDYEFDCHYQMITDQNLHLLKIKIIEHFE